LVKTDPATVTATRANEVDLVVPAKLTAEVDRFVKEVKRLVEVERGGEFDSAWSPQLQSPLLGSLSFSQRGAVGDG
jgi:hypothetical protein